MAIGQPIFVIGAGPVGLVVALTLTIKRDEAVMDLEKVQCTLIRSKHVSPLARPIYPNLWALWRLHTLGCASRSKCIKGQGLVTYDRTTPLMIC